MIAALKPLRAPLLRIGVVLTIFMLQRVLFVLMDQGAFPHTPASAFIGGARFDLSAIAWCYLPWILCVLIAPGPTGILAAVQRALFHLSNVLCFFLNCTDLVYFHFTLKRSTADLFNIAPAATISPTSRRSSCRTIGTWCSCSSDPSPLPNGVIDAPRSRRTSLPAHGGCGAWC